MEIDVPKLLLTLLVIGLAWSLLPYVIAIAWQILCFCIKMLINGIAESIYFVIVKPIQKIFADRERQRQLEEQKIHNQESDRLWKIEQAEERRKHKELQAWREAHPKEYQEQLRIQREEEEWHELRQQELREEREERERKKALMTTNVNKVNSRPTSVRSQRSGSYKTVVDITDTRTVTKPKHELKASSLATSGRVFSKKDSIAIPIAVIEDGRIAKGSSFISSRVVGFRKEECVYKGTYNSSFPAATYNSDSRNLYHGNMRSGSPIASVTSRADRYCIMESPAGAVLGYFDGDPDDLPLAVAYLAGLFSN